jgi:menaquinol-cytochrome c reductase iron-sulfur subunit
MACEKNCDCCEKAKALELSRRRFLGGAVIAINGFLGAVIIGPLLGFMAWPVKRPSRPKKWVAVMEDAVLQEGEVKPASFRYTFDDAYHSNVERRGSVFLKREGGAITAFNTTCTHLGCAVTWRQRDKTFFCPCHGGKYDANGKNIAGPPPAPLRRYQTKVEQGRIYILV